MAGEDDGDAFLFHQFAHQRAHLLDAGRVEAVGRLVEDEEFGAGKERGAEGEALLHAHRQLGHVHLLLFAAEQEAFQHLRGGEFEAFFQGDVLRDVLYDVNDPFIFL